MARQSTTVTVDCTGTGPTPPPTALVLTPGNFNYSATSCVGASSRFVVTGGTPPYNAFFTTGRPGAVINPSTVTAANQSFTVSGLTDTVQTTNIQVVDSGTPVLQQMATITCPATPTGAAMSVSPSAGYTYTAPVCNNPATSSNFVITGGTPPYSAAFSVPGTAGTIAPAQIASSGGGFAVSGLNVGTGPQLVQVAVRDSSPNPALQIVTVSCTVPGP